MKEGENMKIIQVKVYQNIITQNACYYILNENGTDEFYHENNVPVSIINLINTKKPTYYSEGMRNKTTKFFIYEF